MSVEELRAKLEGHEPLTVVDIRDAGEHAEWRVPGAVHADAYDALAARDPAAFDAFALPKDRPVVVVCWQGNTSKVVDSATDHDAIPNPRYVTD